MLSKTAQYDVQNGKTSPLATVQIQAIGLCNAVRTDQLERGDVVLWNYGYTSEVISKRKVSECFFEVTFFDGGTQTHARRLRFDRLIAITAKTALRFKAAGQ